MSKKSRKFQKNTGLATVQKATESTDAKKFKAISLNTTRGYSSPQQIEQYGLRKPGKVTFKILRQIASRDAIIRICINVIKKAVSQSEWIIQVKKNAPGNIKKDYEKEIDTCYNLFEYMNMNGENMRILLDRVMEDILTLDSAGIEIIRSLDGKRIVALNSVDGGTLRPIYNEYGELGDPAYLQLVYEKVRCSFKKEDLVYIMANPSNDIDTFGYGLSAIESILLQVQAALEADMFNIKHFTKDNLPPGILDLGDMTQDQAEEFIATWNATVIGNPHSMKFVRGSSQEKKFIPLSTSQKDMQYIEYINWLSKIKLATYGLSSIDANILQDMTRSTGETMRALSNARGVRSNKKLIEEYFTRNIIRYMEEGNDKFKRLEFKFIESDNVDIQLKQAQVDDLYLQNGVYTANEIRARDGKDPLKEPIFSEELGAKLRTATGKQPEPGLPKQDRRGKEENAKVNIKRMPYKKDIDDEDNMFQKDLYYEEDYV